MKTRIICCSCVFFLLALAAQVWWIEYPKSQEKERYRFGSFAPVRDDSQVKWLVDGQEYMSAVADAIDAAEHEIFITDWQFHPNVYLKRPDDGVTSSEWRLDKLLLKKAKEDGVRIYILLYWETKLVMDLGSDYAISAFNHTNIKIYRHPTYTTPVSHPSTLLRWSHHEKVIVVDRSIAFVGGIDLSFGRWDTYEHDLTDNHPHHPCVLDESKCSDKSTKEFAKKYSRWVGKDYANTFLAGPRTNFHEPLEDYTMNNTALRYKIPRLPWHDVGCSFTGDAAMDVARHFIQRYNAAMIESSWWWCGWWLTVGWCSDSQLSTEDQPKAFHKIINPSTNNVTIQVLRSVGNWSANQPHEDSIYRAYLHAIETAEHFIYIESQFFISSQPKEMFRNVKNEIQIALSERIARAYENGEDFHVMIVLPLLPEFPQEWDKDGGGDIGAVSYWNYATLYNGDDSLFGRLKKRNVPATSLHHYISVYGLRTHDMLNDEPVTELIYVHSKLMIVDDRLTIIGSANINDRSMLGYRDSEVDVIIEDKDMIEGQMNGERYLVGKFSHGLRCSLLREHLGLLSEENQDTSLNVKDPVSYNFYKGVLDVANSNTQIYERVFQRILPTNSISNFKDLENQKTFESLADVYPEKARKVLNGIRGHIVTFPPSFLKNQLQHRRSPVTLIAKEFFFLFKCADLCRRKGTIAVCRRKGTITV